jgi:peptidyl-prolyl cis-trans isomerase B (cyclophilin B)
VTAPPTAVPRAGHLATITTSVGVIKIQLNGEATPCTVASFISLATQGYFNGTHCHRLGDNPYAGFLQCGDPLGTGMGGPGYSFADELSGAETYPAGTVAMANAGPDTNGSQFFMVFKDSDFGGPNYTVFGRLDAASIRLLSSVGAAGVANAGTDGTGEPRHKVVFEKVTIS